MSLQLLSPKCIIDHCVDVKESKATAKKISKRAVKLELLVDRKLFGNLQTEYGKIS